MAGQFNGWKGVFFIAFEQWLVKKVPENMCFTGYPAIARYNMQYSLRSYNWSTTMFGHHRHVLVLCHQGIAYANRGR